MLLPIVTQIYKRILSSHNFKINIFTITINNILNIQ